jgi:hypothetical protein
VKKRKKETLKKASNVTNLYGHGNINMEAKTTIIIN